MTLEPRLYLSPPHLGTEELTFVENALQSNWIAPAGPEIDRFEQEFASCVGVPHALALASGTAGLHLAIKLCSVRPADEVLCSTFTFAASAFPILYEGGIPVFIDSERESWNMDPHLLLDELDRSAAGGRLPKAVIVVHLYGQAANMEPIVKACKKYGVSLIEDAAEALGASYKGLSPGTFGDCGVFSFNGNKIITTSGGGMLVSSDPKAIEYARFLSSQARDRAAHYEHSHTGYNYRISNLLAALGRAQLRLLEDRVNRRRRNFAYYQKALAHIPGISFMPETTYGRSTRWLSVIVIDPKSFGATREDIRLHLESHNIESRPVWKPMHLQPVFRKCRRIGGAVSEFLFEHGLCLPSGSQMSEADLQRVVDTLLLTPRKSAAQVRS